MKGRLQPFVAVAVLSMLSACEPQPDQKPGVRMGETIACAVGGAARFSNDCSVERTSTANRLFLTVHHPDGAFRRFEVMKDGTGIAAADGADTAVSKLSGETLEVTVGPDRYRFPATKTAAAQPGQAQAATRQAPEAGQP